MAPQEEFLPEPTSLRAVRRFVRDAIPGAEGLDDAVLAASEMATSVVRHAETDFTVRVTASDQEIRLEVSDSSSVPPAADDLAEIQASLPLLDAVTDQWGVEATEAGKTIWAELPNEPPLRG